MTLAFRPHHFLCALCFQGRGYSPAFVTNFQTIMDSLNAPQGDSTTIAITPHTDSICAPCPNRRDTKCVGEDEIAVLDTAHAKALDIQANQTLTWGEAKARIKEKITLDIFHDICKTCSWQALGICEGVLTQFLT